jgi:Tol biopolymer transport system component
MQMRLFSFALFLVVLLAGFAAAPGLYAQAIDPNDDFDDGVIDTTKWVLDGDPKSAWQETDGHLTIAMTPETSPMLNLQGTWWLRGPFDIQVDYSLLDWPAHSGAIVGLLLMSPDDRDWEWVQRVGGLVEAEGSDEVYLANVRCPEGCFCEGVTPTSDTSGTLRVTRDDNSLFTAYYWSAADSQWVALYQRPMPDTDVKVRLTLWGPVTEPVTVAFDNFQVNRGELVPTGLTIEDVQIDRGRDTDWWDSPLWHERYTVQVKGTAYDWPDCVLVQDPQGDCKHLPTCGEGFGGCWVSSNPGGSCDFQVTVGPDYTYTYVWYEARKEHPIPEGPYQITVFGNDGNQTTLTTAVVPAVPEEGPVLLGPAADGVVDTTVPTFEWTPLPGAQTTLRLRAEGLTSYTGPAPDEDDCGEIWRASVDGQLAAVYNFDGTGPDLDPGRTYFWQISDWTPVDDRASDPRVSIWNDQTARHRFTINTTWPGLPVLPGRLIYEQAMYGGWSDPYNAEAILQYGTTPAERTWVGPDASHTPSYSWDGTKIAYHLSDWGSYVANADGSDPVRLPVTYGWSGPDFSPDATWLTFADGEQQGGEPQHIYIQKLFEPERTLLVWARGRTTRLPRWSPDGVWIAYVSCCDPSGNNIWLVHPDGTQDHPVLPTTLAGYPGWTITWLGSAVVWSPDATRLGVNFSAQSADGSGSLSGVGTISADGGELTSVFINPPGHVCCATANALCWSPDGASLVFTSAHHLPVNPDWANGMLETGLELWMRDADGTGEPIRLTYDYSYNASAAWWAPNTPVGEDIAVVKGDGTLTFAQVTAEGSTRMHVTSEVPAPAPAGYSFASDIWSGATTAGHQGGITVALEYDASLVGQENRLALMQWNAAKAKWQDITVRPLDETNRIIRGQTQSLSDYAICVAPWPYPQGFDPDDSFDGTAIDTTRWQPWSEQGASVTETGGKLVLTTSPTALGTEAGASVVSTYRLRGAFDIQVDYELTQWPANNDVSIAFCASPRPEDENALLRTSWTGEVEQYSAAFNAWTDPTWISVPTTDTSGKLRLVRDAGNVLFDYYWRADTSQWVLIGSQQVSDADVVVILYIWGNVLAPASVAFDNFQVNSGLVVPPPIITDVQIDRGRDADWWDFSYWHTRYVVQVQGNSDQQPAQLWLQDMQGLRQVINTDGSHWYDPAGENPGGSWEDARVTAGPDDTYTFVWYEARQQLPIPAGSYTITVVGAGGSQTSVTTAELPAVPDAVPTLLGPADQSAIETAVPTFQWLPLSGTKAILQVRAEGDTTYTSPGPDQDDCGEIWRASVDGQLAAVYNFDGTGPDLDPGRTYFWQVDDWTPVDDRVSDPRVSVWNSQTSRHRFTVDTTWPPLPALPGRLAYEQTMYGDTNDPYNLQAILQYGTTPAQRTWVGPDGSHTPSYSWDGTKIAYRVSDWGAHIANADGSDSVQLPGNWDWDSADLSPDATWITYADGEWQGSSPQHIFIQELFEPERTLLVRARGDRAWSPRWSPDGVWISYMSCCDPSGNFVWLVHPDGTDDHPLLPTGVVGYPGATVTWFAGTPAWSPDAKRLGVGFDFTTAEGESFGGIGTISRDGGEITPVWFNPPGVVCCAAAGFQTWSPDGNSIVFTSAHQMPADPDWINGKFEPGVEVWLINADGSGEPARLTYDYSNNPSAAWWAPNTPVGKEVSVVKGDAALTFAQVTAEGSTRMNVTFDVPGAAPEGYAFASDLWSGATTAGYQGDITVALQYDAGLAGEQGALALMQWNAEKAKWQDITARPIDVANCIIRGRTKDLGVFAVCVRTR